ncbi:MAG: hypothetical protein KAI79_19100, partial [Bacteroidales bacterium]|nr:hypothetical protein [Bacteroidales bacterium]
LHELRRYFDSHNNLNSFTNMGKEWKICVDKIHMLKNGRKIDNETLVNIINSYKQEEKDIGLQLTDRSDRFIELVNKKDRTVKMGNTLQKGRTITSQYSIDGDKKHNFFIEIDFLKRSVKCYAKIEIHKGKAKGQTSVLIRKLEDESGYADNILINAFYKGNKSLRNDVSLMQLISEKTNSEPYSILDTKMGDEIKYYEIKTYDLFGKDFISTKRFITKLEDVSYRFLTQVMEHVK